MRRTLWLVAGTEKSHGAWRTWPYYVLAASSVEAERCLQDYEARAFESVVAKYAGRFRPKQLAREWGDLGKDIVKDLCKEGIADLFWWEEVGGEVKLCGVREDRPWGVR